MQGSRWVVLKFGGTSVASAEGWRTIEAAIQGVLAQGGRALVVCSALASVSNTIDRAIDRSERGEDTGPEMQVLRRLHQSLALALGIVLPTSVTATLDELEEGLSAVRLTSKATPRLRARLMALGERMSTRIGAAWLRSRGQPTQWTDARELFDVVEEADASEARRFLQAEVVPTGDPVRLALLEVGAPVVVTQGFVARNAAGETVLLGRGGSDTSASVLGVLLRASRVEIWTDVPGLFTGDPASLPRAKLLPALGYDEAESMAALGAKVLHPRSVRPLRAASIPLHVRSTYHRDRAGTVVGKVALPGVKAVTSRAGLRLVRMRRPVRWQPVGFLADVSACFQRHGLSIDLLSTSPGLITATFDPLSAPRAELDGLLTDLEQVCAVEVQGPVGSISLVGTELRSDLARLGAALATTAGFPIHALLQGASDHHLTLVVDEAHRAELVARLHAVLFEGDAEVGPSSRTIDQDNGVTA